MKTIDHLFIIEILLKYCYRYNICAKNNLEENLQYEVIHLIVKTSEHGRSSTGV